MVNKDWPTEEKDMKIANSIIDRYVALNDGESVGILELMVEPGDEIRFKASDWVLELSDHFDQLYGAEEGSIITNRILMKCLLQDEVIH